MELETSYTVDALIKAHNNEERRLSNLENETEAAKRSLYDKLRDLDNYYSAQKKGLEDGLANAREDERVIRDGFKRFRSQKFVPCEHTALNPTPTPPINSAIRTPAAIVSAFRYANEPTPTPEVEAQSEIYDDFKLDSYSDRFEDDRTQTDSWRNLVGNRPSLPQCPKCNPNAHWVNVSASNKGMAVYFKRADFIKHAKDVHGFESTIR